MKKRILLIFTLALIFTVTFQTLSVYARTRNSLSRTFAAPDGIAMFTDVYMSSSEQVMFVASDSDHRNLVSRIGNGRVRQWESDIDFIFRAPELQMRVTGNIPSGTEFEIRLHNLEWFFRSVEEHTPSIFVDYDYSGGIELLLPTSYNRLRGQFIPNEEGVGGVYTRTVPIGSYEVPFELRVSDNGTHATVVFLRSAVYGDFLRIPIVSRTTNNTRSATVEVISGGDRLIPSGLHAMLSVYTVITDDLRSNATHTSATIHMTGIEELRVPEIVIRENFHGIIENGSIRLEAPEGFIIIPDTPREGLGQITRRTPYFRDEDGEMIIDVRLGGGLSWRNRMVNENLYQQNAVAGTDFRLNYRNPAGNLDPSVLIIQLNNIERSRFRDRGYVVISGLRLAAITDVSPGAVYMEVSAFSGMEELTTQSFRVGTLVE